MLNERLVASQSIRALLRALGRPIFPGRTPLNLPPRRMPPMPAAAELARIDGRSRIVPGLDLDGLHGEACSVRRLVLHLVAARPAALASLARHA